MFAGDAITSGGHRLSAGSPRSPSFDFGYKFFEF
jgi:hypothetical protein